MTDREDSAQGTTGPDARLRRVEAALERAELRLEAETTARRVAEDRADAAAVELEQHRRALTEVRASRAYRLTLAYYRVVERLAPRGTRRRRVYRAVGRSAAHAVRGWRWANAGTVYSYETITVPGTDQDPIVSVVIPVHGHWSATAQCLRSFAEHPPTLPFEVVVVDDASPDDTRLRLGAVVGVRVVALPTNQGFVGAVNAGIAACRGRFVALLNNDTQITSGWLEALTATADEHGVGLVGSKLVYPDGRLQEAGGIMFDDASGWNYGRFGDPSLERYNVRRDVDYCSAAAILLRRDVLEDLGGLDTEFAPAYYDDTDLAFRVRDRGLRVVYEPRAVVIHHEGVSHGTDEASGIKRFQALHRKKMLARWREELGAHLVQDPANVEAAARRQSSRGVIIFIDDHVPRPDEDSGSVRTFAFLRALRGLGYWVVFLAHNRASGDVWGERLRDEGIEVFSGPEIAEEFLVAVRPAVVAVIGARVTVAWPYVGLVRRVLPGVPFVFDTVDLHHLREQREAALAGSAALTRRAEETRALELGLVTAADATLVVSEVEVEVLAREAPSAVVRVVSNVHERRVAGPGPEARDGLLFVGSFAHPPNADAMRWFVREVLPLVRDAVPDAVLRIVGRGAPADLVALAESEPGLEVLGWLPSLDEVYAESRLSIAPLRYGAGVKGKVGEAMSYGVPVVGTTVAMEGMRVEHGVTGWIGDDPAELADGIARLLRDDELWQRLSAAGRQHIDSWLGEAAFEQQVRDALAAVGVE